MNMPSIGSPATMLGIFIFAQKYFMEALHMTSGIK